MDNARLNKTTTCKRNCKFYWWLSTLRSSRILGGDSNRFVTAAWRYCSWSDAMNSWCVISIVTPRLSMKLTCAHAKPPLLGVISFIASPGGGELAETCAFRCSAGHYSRRAACGALPAAVLGQHGPKANMQLIHPIQNRWLSEKLPAFASFFS